MRNLIINQFFIKKCFLKLCVAILFVLISSTYYSQTIRYVKTTGTGDGSSWSNASNDLQLMINQSVSGDQIWVANGVYVPNRPANDLNTIDPTNRNNAFVLKDGVKIYGSFDGTETTLAERNLPVFNHYVNYSSVLSGDFADNDVVSGGGQTLTISGNSENAYHVVIITGTISNETVLDGFTVKGGNANVSTPTFVVNNTIMESNIGGGIYVRGSGTPAGSPANIGMSNPTLTNLVVEQNYAGIGGGGVLFSYHTQYEQVGLLSELNNILLKWNQSQWGGAIRMWPHGSGANLNNCILHENRAIEGGAIYSYGKYTLNSSTVTGNYSTTEGAACMNYGGYTKILNSNFTNNTVSGFSIYPDYENRGIIHNRRVNFEISVELDGVTITNNNGVAVSNSIDYANPEYGTFDVEIKNSAISQNYGAIHNSYCDAVLSHVDITNNLRPGIVNVNNGTVDLKNVRVTGNNRGGIRNNNSSMTLTNVLISNNSTPSSLKGAGVYNNNSNVSMVNVTVSNNHASNLTGGSGISNENGSFLSIKNSIVYDNVGGYQLDLYNDASSVSVYNYSLIRYITSNDNDGNIDGNLNPFTGATSPVINRGNNNYLISSGITNDIDGNPRYFDNGIVDLGAHEYQGGCSETQNPIVYTQNFCNSISSNDLVAIGENLTWYSSIGDLFPTTTFSESGTRYVTATTNGCSSPKVSFSLTNISVTPSVSLYQTGLSSFIANPTHGGLNPTYEFYLNGLSVGPPSSSNEIIFLEPTYNLQPGDVVYVKMYSSFDCVTSSIAWSNWYTIPPPPCPEQPSNLNVALNASNNNLFDISWSYLTYPAALVNYEIDISDSPTPNPSGNLILWSEYGENVIVNGLDYSMYVSLSNPNVGYIHLRAFCPYSNEYSDWVSLPFDLNTYCIPNPLPQEGRIGLFNMGSINVDMIDGASSYATLLSENYIDLSSLETEYLHNEDIAITLVLTDEFADLVTSDYSFSVWVDLNQDYEFDNSNELVSNGSFFDIGSYFQYGFANFTLPETLPLGSYRLRVGIAPSGENLVSCPNSDGVGVFHDYTIILSGVAGPCDVDNQTDVISSCSPITWLDGITYIESNNTATFLMEDAASPGCDVLYTLDFTLWPCTQLQPSSCNATNVQMTDVLGAIAVPDHGGYRFRIVGANNGGSGWNGNTFILDRPVKNFRFSMVPGSIWGETYSVEVAVGDGLGNYGPYGNACDVTLANLPPTTQLQNSQCGISDVSQSTFLFAIQVNNAAGYRFRITGANNGALGWSGNTYILDRPSRDFRFSMVPGVIWGETYSVEVAILSADNVTYGPYGAACNVTLQATPTTALQSSQCGITNVAQNTSLFANAVSGAAGYRFRVVGANNGATGWVVDTYILDRPVRNFKFNMIPGVLQGEEYEVQVAVLNADGNYGAYGMVCSVELEGAPDFVINDENEIFLTDKTMNVVEFGASASHNPFTTDFGIQILNANDVEPINVIIYDMSGKLIESNTVNPMDIESARFGQNLAAGMYMIEVKQGSNQAVIRQVKN